MTEWLVLRWCVAVPLGFLWLLCFIGHVSSIVTVITRGISASVIPFVGGTAGAFAVLIYPIAGAWRWFWLPLLLDIAAFAILTGILSHRSAKRRKAQTKRAQRGG